jgi:hypothetical protein
MGEREEYVILMYVYVLYGYEIGAFTFKKRKNTMMDVEWMDSGAGGCWLRLVPIILKYV